MRTIPLPKREYIHLVIIRPYVQNNVDTISDVVETRNEEAVTKRQARRDAKSVVDAVLQIGSDPNRQVKALVSALARKDLSSHRNMLENHYPRSKNQIFLERIGANVIKTTKELRTSVFTIMNACK